MIPGKNCLQVNKQFSWRLYLVEPINYIDQPISSLTLLSTSAFWSKLLHMTACQSVQRYSQPYSQIPCLPTEAEFLPYMLKCLRQLADSGWFGSNWNTRDRERVRDSSPALMEYSWTCCQDWSCSIKSFSVCLWESDFFYQSVSWKRNRSSGWIS